MTLLGLPWIIAVFTFVPPRCNPDAAFANEWLFNLINSLQGFFIFLLFIVLSSDARKAWFKLCCPCLVARNKHQQQNIMISASSAARGRVAITQEPPSAPVQILRLTTLGDEETSDDTEPWT